MPLQIIKDITSIIVHSVSTSPRLATTAAGKVSEVVGAEVAPAEELVAVEVVAVVAVVVGVLGVVVAVAVE